MTTEDTSPTVPPARDSPQFITVTTTDISPTVVTTRDSPPPQRPDVTIAKTLPTIPATTPIQDSPRPPTVTTTEIPPAVLPPQSSTVTTTSTSPIALPTSDSSRPATATTISTSATVIFAPETTQSFSSPINFLTQTPTETEIPMPTPTPTPSKPRIDRRTIVGLSVGLGLLLVAAIVFAGFCVFKKVKPRIIRAMIHRRPENIIEAYRETSMSSGGMSPLIKSGGLLYTPRVEGKHAIFLSERYSDPDVEAGRTSTAHPSMDSAGHRGPPLVSNSTRTSVLSDSSYDEGSMASLPSYHSQRR
ncbi:hypothetical protein PTI98_004232 [Pleurotus ostreatus]|nr:hypothetical protein PTI98_004232 [Pleurotus ostreatus]